MSCEYCVTKGAGPALEAAGASMNQALAFFGRQPNQETAIGRAREVLELLGCTVQDGLSRRATVGETQNLVRLPNGQQTWWSNDDVTKGALALLETICQDSGQARPEVEAAINKWLAQDRELLARAIYARAYAGVDDERHRGKKTLEIEDWLLDGDLDEEPGLAQLVEEWREGEGDRARQQYRQRVATIKTLAQEKSGSEQIEPMVQALSRDLDRDGVDADRFFKETGLADALSEPEPNGYVPGRGSARNYVPEWMDVPPLYATEDQPLEEKTLVVKLFAPDSDWTWYVAEYDPETGVAFGMVEGFVREWGNFSLAEIGEVKGPLGLSVERDKWFRPRTLADLEAERTGR